MQKKQKNKNNFQVKILRICVHNVGNIEMATNYFHKVWAQFFVHQNYEWIILGVQSKDTVEQVQCGLSKNVGGNRFK